MRLPVFFSLAFVPVLGLSAFACGSSSTGGSDDPRCAAVCTVKVPNSGSYCNQASADSCLQECGARIAGTTAACGDCLLQDASLGGTEGSSSGGECVSPSVMCPTSSACTASGPAGSCTFCSDDQTQAQKCEAMVDPPHAVACSTEFRDPAKCASLCK